MAFWKSWFGGRAQALEEKPAPGPARKDAGAARPWQRLLVPAIGRPYPPRSLEVAYRLARHSGATVRLVYVLEVPRALALDAEMPEEEQAAAAALSAARSAAQQSRVAVTSAVHRTRDRRDGVLRLIEQERIDLLVLGAERDRSEGNADDLTRELFLRAPCEVVLDYVADALGR